MKEVLKPAIKGLLTFIPGVSNLLPPRREGGTKSAAYCYDVWLKHLVFLWESGVRTIPKTYAELGPGDSLGIGLCAMLCGAERYFALDVLRHSNTERNLLIFDELLGRFRSRAPRPNRGWPDFDPFLNDRLFPEHILPD